MDYHQNARLTVHSREQIAKKVLEQGVTLKLAAASFNVSAKTAAKWVRRYREQGVAGLADRSSRPQRLHRPTSSQQIERVVEPAAAALDRLPHRAGHWPEPCHGKPHPAPAEAQPDARSGARFRCIQRYEHAGPRRSCCIWISRSWHASSDPVIASPETVATTTPGAGWEYVHIAIDDHSRLAFSAIYPNETAAVGDLASCERPWPAMAGFGIRFKTVLTDNGPAYHSRRLAACCRDLGLKHRFTRPYTPRTNGKAERFIQTALREWAYACSYENSEQRKQQLPRWLHDYNWHRPHASLKQQPPISRLRIDRNNLLSHHTYSLLPIPCLFNTLPLKSLE